MSGKPVREIPARLEQLRRRFEQWRATHTVRSRLPNKLWAAAVKMAGTFGLHRTSRALRLEYYSLKKRLDQRSMVATVPPKKAASGRRSPTSFDASPTTTFVELAPVAGGCECTVELEDAAGAKMRVRLKSIGMPDLAAISRSFWNPGP